MIEVDGDTHDRLSQKEYDEGRSYALNELGLTVIRFNNAEVIDGIENVLAKLMTYLE